MARKINVTENPEDPIPFEVLERSIVQISESMARMRHTRVSEKLLQVLIKDATGISKEVIGRVLSALDELEHLYLKKRVTK